MANWGLRTVRTALVLVAACGVGGCARSRPAASPAVFQPGPLVTLGAGDSLGTRIYLNDLIIASRAIDQDIVITSVPDLSSFSLVE
ncbi:MAG: hypothetical protein SFY69_09800 [Planctomycetota bacterium]|nr:hypothetical protein [Planctomycetota bacterium]